MFGLGQLKLCDFGLSRKVPTAAIACDPNQLGSPYYVAPELYFDDVAVQSFASDIWYLLSIFIISFI